MGKVREASKIAGLVLAVNLAFGSILGLESNIQPFNPKRVKVQDTSFKGYSSAHRERYGDIRGIALALWSYPGARLGAEIYNYKLPNNSD